MTHDQVTKSILDNNIYGRWAYLKKSFENFRGGTVGKPLLFLGNTTAPTLSSLAESFVNISGSGTLVFGSNNCFLDTLISPLASSTKVI